MSATAGELRVPPIARTSGLPLTVRAFLLSRLIVLVAGTVGSLALPRFAGWSVLDPDRISTGLGTVGNVLAGSAVRWDAVHYLTIARGGYTSAASAVFFPAYPLLIRSLGWLVGSQVIAAVLISALSFAAAMVMLHRLTEHELGRPAADMTVLMFVFVPTSFFFTAVYTESLFLALSLGALLAARSGRLAAASALGALAAVTRITGVLVLILVLGAQLGRVRRIDWSLTPIVAIPLALIAYLGVIAADGYGFLAPFVQQTVAHGHQLSGPAAAVAGAVRVAAGGAGSLVTGGQTLFDLSDGGLALSGAVKSVELLLVLGISLLALGLAFRRLPITYGLYAAAALLVSISSPVAAQPLSSLDRYTLTIFPLWMAAGAWLAERRPPRVALVIGAVLLAVSTAQFASWTFVA